MTAITLEHGLDYILRHFEDQTRIWPRTISTKTTKGRQVLAYSRQEALARFKQANWLDCRISAYPTPSEVSCFVGINLDLAPDIIMIDLDRQTFQTKKAFSLALSKMLNKIREMLNFQPTVIWSGSGYHIYLVLDAFVLETEDAFNNRWFGQQPSQKFLRFAEIFLSNGKCDLQHNKTVSFRNMMLRIPGSINSKNGQTVIMIQKWNGHERPSIKLLLEDFYVYLCDQRIKELTSRQKRRQKQRQKFSSNSQSYDNSRLWIEKLLQTPLQDYRKFAIWRILAPYLINVKKFSEQDASNIIREWLDKCDKLRKLSFNPDQKIREGLNGAAKGYFPIRFEVLKQDNSELYNVL